MFFRDVPEGAWFRAPFDRGTDYRKVGGVAVDVLDYVHVWKPRDLAILIGVKAD
jgi:hypothetical protein